MQESILCLFGATPPLELSKDIIVYFCDQESSPCEGDGPYVIHMTKDVCDFALFGKFCERFAFASFAFVIASTCVEEAWMHRFISRLQEIQWHAFLRASQWEDFGIGVFRNLWKNRMLTHIDRTSWQSLKGTFLGVPAWICGAGPSLSKNLALLQSMQGKSLCMTGGAAYALLKQHNIDVDIALGLDSSFSLGCDVKASSCFFFQERFHHDNLQHVLGPRFALPGNPGHALEEWFSDGMLFDGGWTVVTLGIALAKHLGCDPIVLIGADFAASVDSASLYVQGANAQDKEGVIHEGVLAKKEWVLAARWLEDFIERHPQSSFYRASEDGLFIRGVQPYSSAAIPSTCLDVKERLLQMQTCWQPSEDQGKLLLFQESVERCAQYLDEMLKLFGQTYPKSPVELGSFIVMQVEFENEFFYHLVLQPLWQVWQYPLQASFQPAYTLQKILMWQRVLCAYQEVMTCSILS